MNENIQNCLEVLYASVGVGHNNMYDKYSTYTVDCTVGTISLLYSTAICFMLRNEFFQNIAILSNW